MLKSRRVYENPTDGDGVRILVDRLWPRGVSKKAAQIDHWFRELAPSTELRQWYRHEPERWEAFRKRYVRELDAKPELVARLLDTIGEGEATLLFGSKEERLNNATVLQRYLEGKR
jgi:uncharacterized protein YeaO (DUF488 family)